MPADLIQAQYDTLDTIITRLRARSADLDTLIGRLRAESADLFPYWKGEAADAFFSEFDGLILPSLERMREAFDETAVFTENASADFQDAEQRASTLFTSGEFRDVPGSGITAYRLPPSTEPHNSFLPPGYSLHLTRSGDKFTVDLRDANGQSVKLPSGTNPADALTAIRSYLETGGTLNDVAEGIANGRIRFLSRLDEALQTARNFDGWKQFAAGAKAVGLVIDGASILIDGLQLLDGSNAHIETTELAMLPNGVRMVFDKVIDEDAQLISTIGSAIGSAVGGGAGLAGGAAIGGAAGTFIGGPAGTAVGAGIGGFVGSTGGAIMGGEAGKKIGDLYDGSWFDHDPDITPLPSDVTVENGEVRIHANPTGRIDVGRLLPKDGSAIIEMRDGQFVIRPQ
ncbi:MAG: WXG100 family type VII secretion target [bacterium]|nr:WXG100 family type VII secretion target [bacterium]